MEKLVVLLIAVFMMLSFSMVGFASDQSAVGTQQQTMPEKKMDQKEKTMIYRGEVTSFDQTGHTIVVKGKEGEKTFDVSQATMKGKIEPEHYVAVKYTETNGKMVASSVWAVSHKASSNMKSSKLSSNVNSSTWKQLDSVANNEYAGIGEATKIGLASGGKNLARLDELSGSESQTTTPPTNGHGA